MRIATAVAVLGAAGIISGCAIEQPSAGCLVQDSNVALWAGKYHLTKEADASLSCGKLTGEALGVWKYADPKASPQVVAENRASKIAIRPRGAASITAYSYSYQVEKDGVPQFYPNGEKIEAVRTEPRVANPNVATNLSSTFYEEPDAEGMCKATGFNQTRVEASEVRHFRTGEQLVAPKTVEYLFDSVEVYSDPSAPGTQLRGTMTYGDGTGCRAEYEVWAMWPLVGCDPAATEESAKCGEGSGINPDFDVVCDATMARLVVKDANTGERWPGTCRPARRPPSFK